jgi:hypothetical protein
VIRRPRRLLHVVRDDDDGEEHQVECGDGGGGDAALGGETAPGGVSRNSRLTTDGIPARSSMAGRTMLRIQSGATSARKIAPPSARGTPRMMAPMVTQIEPAIIARMPYCSRPGRQTVLVKSLAKPISWKARNPSWVVK